MLSQELAWAIGMLLLAITLGILEFLVPSAGLLGIAATLSLGAGVFLAFAHSTLAGLVAIGIVLFGLPAFIVLGLRVWPYTPIGRGILNLPPDGTPLDSGADDPRIAELRGLSGRVGVAKNDLLPSGIVEIDGRRYDVVAVGAAVNRGEFVEVFSIEGGRVRVRPTHRSPAPPPQEDLVDSESLAGRSLDDLGLDDLGDPLQ